MIALATVEENRLPMAEELLLDILNRAQWQPHEFDSLLTEPDRVSAATIAGAQNVARRM